MSFKANKRTVLLLALVLAIAVSSTMCVSAASSTKQDFGIFEMNVPNDVELTPLGMENDDNFVTLIYINTNEDTVDDVALANIWISDFSSKIPSFEDDFDVVNKTRDSHSTTTIYKSEADGETAYWVIKEFDSASAFGLMGHNLKMLKKMSKSVKFDRD